MASHLTPQRKCANARGSRRWLAIEPNVPRNRRRTQAPCASEPWSLASRASRISQLVLVWPTYSLLQVHLLRHGHQEFNRGTWPTGRRLLPDRDRVIIYRQQCVAFFTLLEHMELTLSLEGKARGKALAKARRLLQDAPARDAERTLPSPAAWRPPAYV
jgi:hypothetical protein